MTIETDERTTGIAMLLLYAPFFQQKLIDDRAFRESLALDVNQTIGIDHGAVDFDREKFDAATAALYASGGQATNISDTRHRKWRLSLETVEDGTAIHLTHGKTEYRLKGAPMLMPGAADRNAAFTRMLNEAGLPPDQLVAWRGLIGERILTSYEIEELETQLDKSPVAAARRIRTEVAGAKGHIATIAPPFRSHYEAFAGARPVADVVAYREKLLPGIVGDWLRWDEAEGAKMALLTASHGSFTAASPLVDLPPDRLVALAEWACESADLISKIGMVELGLAALPSASGLVAPLTKIVEELRDLDPDTAGARAQLLMAAYVIVEGELARTKILADLPPFQRRIAALAQASLFERIAFGQVDADHFGHWALDVRGRNFLLQSLIDLRREPRWAPDGASPDRLDADFMGRIRNAASTHAANIGDPALHELLLGTGPGSISGRLHFPTSFLPGPIEGATDPAADPPQEFVDILDRTLGGEDLTAHSVIALINVSSLFRVENERIDRAIELIRAASFHFSGEMARRLRLDGDAALPASKEFMTCLIAAAAHAELDEWARFTGDCAVELAFAVDDPDEARFLHSDMTYLCAYEPSLRSTMGRALAALEAFLGY